MFERLKKIAYTFRSAISTLSNPRQWLVEMFGGGTSKSGATVNEDTAVKVTAVFACIRLLAQTLASLPLHTYRRVGEGKEKAFDHPLYYVLHSMANPECTSYNFRQIMMVNLLLTGHAYAEIVRNKAGEIVELWPIPSNSVAIRRNNRDVFLFYEIYLEDGSTKKLYPDKILHIPWVGMTNLESFRPVVLAREAIGLSIAAEEFGSRFFESGANASGIAEYPNKMSDEAYERFKKTFTDTYTGLDKNQRVMFLEQGLKFTKLTINPNEAQAIETREFQVVEIARFYNVPPHLIMDLRRATFSNIEHQDIGFVKYSLRPYLVCWEQEILKSLLLSVERRIYFSEFSVDGLLRGDAKSRAEALDIQMRNGVINADEWRALENMNPQPDGLGKVYYVPLNWIPKAQSLEPPDEGERQNRLPLEKRVLQERSAKIKLQTAHSYKRLFHDAAERVVKREKKQVLDKAKKTLTERSQPEFMAWLEEYYREAPEWMKRMLMPSLLTYADAMQRLAADEINAESGMTPELEKWMDGYGDIWARNYTSSSLGQIKDVITRANEEGLDPLESVETRLDEWETRRPGKVADNEVIEAAGVISKFVYAGAGVRYLRWVTAGSKTCPYCAELSGRVVGIDQAFVGKNDRLASEDGVMEIRKPALTPPLHQGCVCMIVPE